LVATSAACHLAISLDGLFNGLAIYNSTRAFKAMAAAFVIFPAAGVTFCNRPVANSISSKINFAHSAYVFLGTSKLPSSNLKLLVIMGTPP
jgi:hypothetical protein